MKDNDSLFSRSKFSEVLHACHNIIRNNDKLSPEASFDEISKILFIKIQYERTNHNVFSKDVYEKLKVDYLKSNNSSSSYYLSLFEMTKDKYKADGLFGDYETLRIRENSFVEILKELEQYDLSRISDDIKGIAFEQFLGKTFRGELGQFFTPRTIVDFMVSVISPKEDELVCDPCCGSGGFLIKVFEFVKEKIMSDDTKSETEKLKRIKSLASEQIFGTDANPRMARTAKMNMIMHGDGHSGVHHHDGLLNVNGIFENRFDVILTNPPFGARLSKSLLVSAEDQYKDEEQIKKYISRFGENYQKALGQVTENIGKPIAELYKTSKYGSMTEVVFVERCLNLLKPGGRMAIILPEGVLSNNNLVKFREFVESKAKIISIVSLPLDVFAKSGASVKTSIVFMKKFTDCEENLYRQAEEKAMQESLLEVISKKGFNHNTVIDSRELYSCLDKKDKETVKKLCRKYTKKWFDYNIFAACIEKAGVNSLGDNTENELLQLACDLQDFLSRNNLW